VDQVLVGNGQITARVLSVENTDPSAKAGVMILESLAAGAKNAAIVVSPVANLSFQRRIKDGANTKRTNGGNFSAPYWLRLTGSGSSFAAYRSPDGVTWIAVGSASITMANAVHVGLAGTSHDNSTLNTSTFDKVSVVALPQPDRDPPPLSIKFRTKFATKYPLSEVGRHVPLRHCPIPRAAQAP
jgi:hypothetical protein